MFHHTAVHLKNCFRKRCRISQHFFFLWRTELGTVFLLKENMSVFIFLYLKVLREGKKCNWYSNWWCGKRWQVVGNPCLPILLSLWFRSGSSKENPVLQLSVAHGDLYDCLLISNDDPLYRRGSMHRGSGKNFSLECCFLTTHWYLRKPSICRWN